MAVTAHYSRWSARADAFVSAGILVGAALTAMALARQARGRWVLGDAILPVLSSPFPSKR